MSDDRALENFADSDDELDNIGGADRFRDAVLYGTDWTVQTLLRQITEGNIDLSPNFQRRDAWLPKNKSRFIESVILQLPIPQIVLAERKEQRGTYIVLDGKQRLLTLAQFAGQLPADHPIRAQSRNQADLRLSGLKIIPEVNGLTYSEISENPAFAQTKTQFDNHTIRSSLIRNWPDDDYLYELFIRLNTGSSRLSPQELRQALKPGPFTVFLNAYTARSQPIKNVLGISSPDFRMRDTDLLLRLIAFQTSLKQYTGNLKPFLDQVHDRLNRDWERQEAAITQLCGRIDEGLNFLSEAFDGARNVGRRWRDDSYETSINRAVMDVQIASALCPEVVIAQRQGEVSLQRLFQNLCSDNAEFVEAISGTTKSIHSIVTRYGIWKRAISSEIGEAIAFPQMPGGEAPPPAQVPLV